MALVVAVWDPCWYRLYVGGAWAAVGSRERGGQVAAQRLDEEGEASGCSCVRRE